MAAAISVAGFGFRGGGMRTQEGDEPLLNIFDVLAHGDFGFSAVIFAEGFDDRAVILGGATGR